MTTTTATMTYVPSAPTSVADATASTIVLRRGHSATPLFLHRTPVYQVRSTASMSHLPTCRPPTSPIPSSSSAPAAEHARSESTAGRILVSAGQPYAAHARAPAFASAVPSPPRRTGSPRTSFNRQPHIIPALRPPPPNKALPPIPFPSGPPTPPEDTSAAPEYFASVTPSRMPAARPVSQDTEDTIRELEELAASLKQMSGSTASASTLSTCRDRDRSPVKVSVSALNTPRRRPERRDYAGGPSSFASRHLHSETSVLGPLIVVTNASMETLPALGQLSSASVTEKPVIAKNADLEGVSWKGEDPDAEEVLWVDEYGAWGASEKGKWKAIDEEADDIVSEQNTSSRSEALRARPSVAEKSFIYEPGAPEFLIGSSTSRNARVGTGYHSRRPLVHAAVPSTRRPRRPRPAPLVLANSAQDELALATALLLGTPRKRPSSRRPQTAPHTTPHTPRASRARQPTPPSAPLPERLQATYAAEASSSRSAEPSIAPALATTATEHGHADAAADSNRHSEPLPAMPRVPSSAIHVLRGKFEHAHARPMTAPSVANGSHSEPNSPRPAVRPRLKSLKGLFKHWSK
ncbi:hypothetical protein L226DRAFT_373678 [Lentinus tigrinus ALCF2SS1-7]|uniref:uncharacterized protein n=1 Tax=Lentinus tigrinus ALCF2SS1-7 TaxID=1328758 RepID=UPI0011663478|nr:hypothetical protein L226DRAFT_373678 [Lentinus tigrinus ALCF2SS1-7]